jgi:hypothetical protein
LRRTPATAQRRAAAPDAGTAAGKRHQQTARPHGDARTNANRRNRLSLPSQVVSITVFSLPSASSAAPTETEVAQVEPIAPSPSRLPQPSKIQRAR